MATGDTATAFGEALGVGETDTYKLGQPGSDRISGIIERATTSADVVAVWQDEDGTDLIEETLTSVTGGSKQKFDSPSRGVKCRLEVRDTGSGSGDYSLAAILR
jgi:hypothetical protein